MASQTPVGKGIGKHVGIVKGDSSFPAREVTEITYFQKRIPENGITIAYQSPQSTLVSLARRMVRV